MSEHSAFCSSCKPVPITNRNVEREFLSFFKNVSTPDQIKNMKWCDFFAVFLIEDLVRYKTSTAKTRKCWGCVHILAVIFYDFVTPDVEITDKQFPRINHITQDDLNTLACVDLDELSKKVKPLDQTVYKEDYRVGEVARPELTGHSNDTVADASMNSQPSLSIALLDEEKRLPIGKKITAIGLCRAKNAESVEITSCPEIPFFLSELTKDEMQAQLASRARILFWGSIVLGTLSVCLVGHTIYRGWKRIKLWREARQAQQMFEDAEDAIREDISSDDDDDEVGDGQLCVVCLRKRRRAAFIPCGHLVCCCKCALRMECEVEPLCPMCRQDIRYMIRIYDS